MPVRGILASLARIAVGYTLERMKLIHKIQLRMSEVREKLRTLLEVETRDAAQDTELGALTTEGQKLEADYRAALVAESDTEREIREAAAAGGSTDDPETRERREIRSRTGLGDYLRAVLTGGGVAGAAAEFNAACGVAALDAVPMELFDAEAREARRQRAEARAVTPGPAIDDMARPTIPYVFEKSVVSTLGCAFPGVASGMQQIPAITTAPPSDTLAEDAAAPSTAAAYTLASRSPKRISGAIEFSLEDLAVHPQLESDLRMALQGAMSNELDESAINGGGGTDLNGLFSQATDVAASGTTDSFPLGLAAFAAQVDGRYANGMMDLRALIGPSTFAAYMALYHGGSGDMTLFEKLRGLMASIVVSDRMPAVSGGAQKALLTRNAGMEPIRIYTWDAMQLIRDPYSGAGTGKVTVTAIALVSDPFVPYGTSQIVELNRDLS